ncbi:MAG: hypothetical protein HRT44_06275, partial [Bdellovibrionales bacterium]|nr:hypothetical protein [Bdellovibrionales bacterium]NQZ18848.1 hypothetical protein [Bdellovibrionales bacterium]
MRTEIKLIILILLMFGFANCTKKPSQNSSVKIQFAAKGVSAQSLPAEDIGTITVNVSGPGIEGKIVEQKECRDPNVVCDSLSIQVPTGQDRLIQLLVVTNDNSATFSDTIFYGDTLTAVSGETSVPLGISALANLTNEAQIAGQYVPQSGHALAGKHLTGEVEVEVSFPGKPTMNLGSSEMFAGWYEFFLVENISFRYFFTGWDENESKISSTEIFNDVHGGSGFELNSVQADGNKVVKFTFDGSIFEENDSGGLSSNSERFENQIVAFLGASTYNACYSNPVSAGFDFGFEGYNSNSTSLMCEAQSGGSCTDFLTWNEITRSLTDTEADCSILTPGTDWLLDINYLNYGDEFRNFRGLFKSSAAGGLIFYDNALFELQWFIHEDMTPPRIDVFTKVDANLDEGDLRNDNLGEGYDCSSLTSQGFVLAGSATNISGSNRYRYSFGADIDPDL